MRYKIIFCMYFVLLLSLVGINAYNVKLFDITGRGLFTEKKFEKEEDDKPH